MTPVVIATNTKGMVPFFGGRSTLWSAWCPRPTIAEMDGWPAEVIANAEGGWSVERPQKEQYRVDATVHESSTLYIGEEGTAPVDLNYRLRGVENVCVTGGGLWPQGGSWNPTLTMVALSQHLADVLEKKRDQG